MISGHNVYNLRAHQLSIKYPNQLAAGGADALSQLQIIMRWTEFMATTFWTSERLINNGLTTITKPSQTNSQPGFTSGWGRRANMAMMESGRSSECYGAQAYHLHHHQGREANLNRCKSWDLFIGDVIRAGRLVNKLSSTTNHQDVHMGHASLLAYWLAVLFIFYNPPTWGMLCSKVSLSGIINNNSKVFKHLGILSISVHRRRSLNPLNGGLF